MADPSDFWIDEDDGHGEDFQLPATQLSDSYLLGFVLANIVGLRYYTGRISGREMVGLVREPLNPHDSNAIKVLNTRSTQVGHIERSVAAVLAPLLDSRLVTVEAIVPKPPPNKNPFRLPCQVHIFSQPEAFQIVQAAILSGGLQLISHSDHGFSLSEAAIVKERNSKVKKKDGRSVDEIFALVGKGDSAVEAVEPPKDVILTELFVHQKEGLGWLVKRENSDDLPPFWEERDGGFANVLTNYETNERPEALRGGIFADDMGLGKTLTLLSLIAKNGVGGGEGSFDGRKLKKSGKRVMGSGRKRRRVNDDDDGNGGLVPKATLVVCPTSVFTAWIGQLEEHTKPGSLKVYLYHGERTRETEVLASHDIVMTTYKTLASEFKSSGSPLLDVEWLRVILDEAHVIKNFAAQQTKAVIALKAKRRWVVTGTPIQNGPFDLFSLMAFLRFQPFSIKSYWQSFVQRPLDQGNKSGMSRLQSLIGSISLRRMKEVQNGSKSLVGLPPKTIETCFVDLSDEERGYYDQMESEAQNTIREYIDADTLMHNYTAVLHIILRLRQICNDVALCPSDIKLLLSSSTLEDVSKNPELLRKLGSLVEDGDDFDCPVCLSPPPKVVITRCTHIFCETCILKTLKHLKACCPICRHPLSKSDLFSVPPPKPSDDDDTATGSLRNSTSSKVSMLLKLLLASKTQNPSAKSVVFSQFRKMLIMLEEPLKAAGFRFLRLDGATSMKKRTEVIKEFEKGGPGAPVVLLASLKAAGAGINLTAASRVYLVEPWWNPAIEEQAMDRVHRIGQKEEVRVVRLIVRESIEERILELQDKKRRLAGGLFGRKAAKEQEMRVEDLRTMMRL